METRKDVYAATVEFTATVTILGTEEEIGDQVRQIRSNLALECPQGSTVSCETLDLVLEPGDPNDPAI